MNLIAACADSTGANALECLQTRLQTHLQRVALCGVLALVGLLGAGQALAASSPPFVDNGDGTVTDTSTGLMWDQCTWGQTSAGGGCTGGGTALNWDAAMGLNTTGYKGYSDWRVPGLEELKSLLKVGATSSPTIDTAAFPATQSAPYWTSTSTGDPGIPVPSDAWVVYFSFGSTGASVKANTFSVRLVRSGQCFYPFSVLPVTVTAVGTTTAAFTATSSVAATGYWVVVARNAQTPLPAQIKAHVNYAGVTVVASGSVAMGAGSPASVAVAGLALGSQYDMYLWPEKAGSTLPGCVAMQPLATTAISTSAIVIDPVTPTTLYAGLDGAGAYKKTSLTDWTAATTQPANLRVKALVIKPGDSSKLFAATYGGGVFQSSDSGVNWNVPCGNQPGNLNLLSLVIDAAGKLYAGSEAGVFVSTDSCASWSAMNTGMP